MSATHFPATDFDQLAARLAGDVVAPGDATYDQARMGWNLSADQRPAAIAFCENADDVAAVVRHAAQRGLRVAPQGTGHNATARTSLAGSILLRTDRMRGVEVDVAARTCRADAGVLWIEVMEAIEDTGLVALCGSSPDVGVVGFSLGGGIGWLSRELGLAADSVTAIDVVTGDGRELRASADEHADLFWALRGGSGSYGVVTAIEFTLHPVTGMVGGAMLFDWTRSREVLHAWREWTLTAPESVTTSARILQFPPIPEIPEPVRGRSFVIIDGAVIGTTDEANAVLAPLRALGPEIDLWAPTTPVGLPRIHMDPEDPMPGMSDHAMLSGLDAEAIDALVDSAGPGSGSPILMVELRHVGGALGRRRPGCGALGALDAEYVYFAAALNIPELAPLVEGHFPRLRGALARFATGGHYLNFQEESTDVGAAFPIDGMSRMRMVKSAYDRTDVIHANHPVAPLPA